MSRFHETDPALAEVRNRNVGRMLWFVLRDFERDVLESIKAAGYSDILVGGKNVIREIELSGGVRLTELAARCGVSKQAVGAHVEELEARGYVRKEPDASDGRARRVVLTDRGRDLLVAGTSIIRRIEEKWAKRLGTKRFEALKASLEVLADDQGAG